MTEIGEAQKSRILGLPVTDAQEKRIEVLAKKAGAAKAKAGPKAAPKKKRFEISELTASEPSDGEVDGDVAVTLYRKPSDRAPGDSKRGRPKRLHIAGEMRPDQTACTKKLKISTLLSVATADLNLTATMCCEGCVRTRPNRFPDHVVQYLKKPTPAM